MSKLTTTSSSLYTKQNKADIPAWMKDVKWEENEKTETRNSLLCVCAADTLHDGRVERVERKTNEFLWGASMEQCDTHTERGES